MVYQKSLVWFPLLHIYYVPKTERLISHDVFTNIVLIETTPLEKSVSNPQLWEGGGLGLGGSRLKLMSHPKFLNLPFVLLKKRIH